MVKPKTGIFLDFCRTRKLLAWVLPALFLLTFISSWAGVFQPGVVERSYARSIFPQVSHFAGRFADLVGFSWLDATVPIAVLLGILLVRKRKWIWLVNVAAGLYLIFFWTWGLNYQRLPRSSKRHLDSARMQPQAIGELARSAAA